MKVGDKLTVAGVDWVARPFTAAEHERFDALAEQYDLERKAAELQALTAQRGGTARETLLRADQRRLQAKLAAYLDENGAPREDLTEDERVAAYGLAAELDELTERLEAHQRERAVKALIKEEELNAAREAVVIAFMHSVIAPKEPLDAFQANLTPGEVAQLEEAVVLGKLRLGLSASTRRRTAQVEKVLAQAITRHPSDAGNASASPQPPPAAPRKRGPRGRSKTSSSRSKGGS